MQRAAKNLNSISPWKMLQTGNVQQRGSNPYWKPLQRHYFNIAHRENAPHRRACCCQWGKKKALPFEVKLFCLNPWPWRDWELSHVLFSMQIRNALLCVPATATRLGKWNIHTHTHTFKRWYFPLGTRIDILETIPAVGEPEKAPTLNGKNGARSNQLWKTKAETSNRQFWPVRSLSMTENRSQKLVPGPEISADMKVIGNDSTHLPL